MSSSHGTPAEGATCACCWDDISAENYVEYLPFPSAENNHHPAWLPSGFCETCLNHLLKTQFSLWTESLAKSTCLAEQRRLLRRGPPVNVRDDKALPCPNNEEVHKLWYNSSQQEQSAKLEGSLEGQERERFWQEQIKLYSFDEKEEDQALEAEEDSKQDGKESKYDSKEDSKHESKHHKHQYD